MAFGLPPMSLSSVHQTSSQRICSNTGMSLARRLCAVGIATLLSLQPKHVTSVVICICVAMFYLAMGPRDIEQWEEVAQGKGCKRSSAMRTRPRKVVFVPEHRIQRRVLIHTFACLGELTPTTVP